MARLVTRVTSKNFCIVNPSFELSEATDASGEPMIQVNEGQACINGMDIIANQKIFIYHPDEAGDYYLALHLWRDSSSNVLGDLVIGVTKEFHGVYLDWYTEKDEDEVDALWLGKVHWDGTAFTSIEEDLDKYGRLWARDILCKLEDWKHPNDTRLLLQDWLYKVPDWYVSKEGDVIFGPVEFLAGRDPNVDGTLADHEDLGSGKYGIRLEAPDTNHTNITIKAPNVSDTDTNRVIKIEESNTGLRASIGPATINSVSSTGYNFVFNTPNKLDVSSDSELVLTGGTGNFYSRIDMMGNAIEFSNANNPVGEVDLTFNNDNINLGIGPYGNIKYDTSDVLSIINTNGPININSENGTGNVNVYADEFHVEGDITAQRVWNAVYNDLAEYMEKADYKEEIKAGDIVIFTPDGKVTKPQSATGSIVSDAVAGIVSGPDTMGFVLGGEGLAPNQRVPVALAGRVYLNVGELAVQVGDLIALSNTGNLEIVNEYTRAVVGKATKSSENGRVYVLVK